MQIILTEEEYKKLQPISKYSSYELACELVERCKLNSQVKITNFEIRTKVPFEGIGAVAKYKVSVERVELK